jgi:uncharacterized protein (TIGR02271 family)
MTHTTEEMRGWIGHNVVDAEGNKIGRIDNLYVDEQTDQPEWLAVTTGWFGTNISFVPLAQATRSGNDLMVPYTKDHVKEAPNVDPEGRLSEDDEARLYRHYGFEYDFSRSDTGLPAGGKGTAGTASARTASARGRGREDSGDDEAMTRSEEEMRVDTEATEAGRLRLRKWVETEHVTKTVPVKKERARLEREPITEDNIDEATSGPELSDAEHEVVLHEEKPVVTTETVPKERVRVTKETEVEEQPVEADLRKERIETDGDAARP